MPKSSTHILRWHAEEQIFELSSGGNTQERFGPADEASWLHWLATHHSFSFQGQQGRMSVIKESRPRGTGGYWYAYRSRGRHTVKRYLGRDDDLSFGRLDQMASTLAQLVLSPQHATSEPYPSDEPTRPLPQPSPAWPLLSSKLSTPRLPVLLVERTHLLSRLESTLAHTLTLLQAPAGFGKTTLVNQWVTARSSTLAVAWVSLDADDNDAYRFWRYVITACRKVLQPHLGLAALEQLSGARQSFFTGSPLETALTLLLNDLAQQKHDTLLVLDDYHSIEETRIHETLTFFLDHLPPMLHVLLLSRTEPPLPRLRWRARGTLYELHLADLRFSREETATFLRQALPLPLSEMALTHLDALLEGWAAGLRLLSLSLRGHHTQQEIEQTLFSLGEHSDIRSSPYQPLFDYLVTEILERQPEPLQRFLLQTSVLSRLSAPLCDAVIGWQSSAQYLEAIERSGLLLEALDNAGVWYRYHALLAETLRHYAKLRLGEEALQTLSMQASRWYEQHGRLEEAIEYAFQARDLARVALLIEQADAKQQDIEPQMLRRWLVQMPEEMLHAHPMLCLLFAILLRFPQQGNENAPLPIASMERIEQLLKVADETWRGRGQLHQIGTIKAFRALGAWQSGPMDRAVEYAQQALIVLPEHDTEPRIHRWRGLCLCIVGSGHMHEGRFDEARRLLWEAQASSHNYSDQGLTRGLILLLAFSYYAQGQLHQAAECYRQVLALAREQASSEHTADALLGLARLAFEWNDLATAEQQTREAFELLHNGQELRESAAIQLALLQHTRGETIQALQQVSALITRLQPVSTSFSLLLLPAALSWQARLYLALGNIPEALHSQEILARYDCEHSLPRHLLVPLLHIRLSLAQGHTDEAQLALGRLLPIAQARRDVYDILEIQTLLALTHAACQRIPEAGQWLTQALTLAQSEGFMRLFLSEGTELARLLRQIMPTIQNSTLRTYAQTILGAFATSSDQKTLPELPFAKLSPQEQRVLRLLVAGHTNPQIAQELVVSTNTVKDHVKRLYRKLGVNNRLQASEAARRFGLL